MLEGSHLAVRISKHPGEDLTQSLQLHTAARQDDSVTQTTKTPHISAGLALFLPRPPEHPLALEQVLQSQQPLLPLGPVGAGAVVQNFGHILRLPHVMRRPAATIAGAVGALGAGAGGVAVGVIVRVQARGLEAPPHRPPLSERKQLSLFLGTRAKIIGCVLMQVCEVILRSLRSCCVKKEKDGKKKKKADESQTDRAASTVDVSLSCTNR